MTVDGGGRAFGQLVNLPHDRLTELLSLQYRLQVDSFKLDPTVMTPIERMEFIRWNVLALEDELHEMLAETGWKPWAKSQHVNEPAAHSELVDAFHFFMNLMLVTGMDMDELYDKYTKKRALNARRQEEGYTGLNKCPGCGRALDDATTKCRKPSPEQTNLLGICDERGAIFKTPPTMEQDVSNLRAAVRKHSALMGEPMPDSSGMRVLEVQEKEELISRGNTDQAGADAMMVRDDVVIADATPRGSLWKREGAGHMTYEDAGPAIDYNTGKSLPDDPSYC